MIVGEIFIDWLCAGPCRWDPQHQADALTLAGTSANKRGCC